MKHIERTYKLIVWHKGTSKIAWTEIIKSLKTERDLEEQVEGQLVNTNLFDYVLSEL